MSWKLDPCLILKARCSVSDENKCLSIKPDCERRMNKNQTISLPSSPFFCLKKHINNNINMHVSTLLNGKTFAYISACLHHSSVVYNAIISNLMIARIYCICAYCLTNWDGNEIGETQGLQLKLFSMNYDQSVINASAGKL